MPSHPEVIFCGSGIKQQQLSRLTHNKMLKNEGRKRRNDYLCKNH